MEKRPRCPQQRTTIYIAKLKQIHPPFSTPAIYILYEAILHRDN